MNKKTLPFLIIIGFSFLVSFFIFNNSQVSATSHCINRATGSPPNESAIVRQVASEHPDWLANSCQSQGGTWQFMDEVMDRLHARDSRWAYNCKRGNCGDPSNDAIAYFYGSGSPSGIRAYEVFVIDIIGGHCGSNPSPAWIDQTQVTQGSTFGGFLFPRTAGGSLPSASYCTGGGPPPPPPPGPPGPPPPIPPGSRPPQILGATPNVVRAGQTLAIIGVDLTENVRIESADGQYIQELTASLNIPKTNAEITLPTNIPAGRYFVTVSSQAGSDIFPNLFTVTQEPVQPFEIPPARDFGDLIENIFTWALWLVGAAIFVNFLWAGLLWFTAADRTGPIGQAKEKMFYALIGAIILLASYLILNTINPDLVKQTFILPGL